MLTINNLVYAKVCNSCDGCDGLILGQVEGAHHEPASIDVGVIESGIQC